MPTIQAPGDRPGDTSPHVQICDQDNAAAFISEMIIAIDECFWQATRPQKLPHRDRKSLILQSSRGNTGRPLKFLSTVDFGESTWAEENVERANHRIYWR